MFYNQNELTTKIENKINEINKTMEALQSRILIEHVKGATIAYLYNRESFDLLNITKDTYDSSQFIEVGNVIEYNGTKYKVESVNFKMEKELYESDNKYGINLYSPSDVSGYNCQIGVFVDNV